MRVDVESEAAPAVVDVVRRAGQQRGTQDVVAVRMKRGREAAGALAARWLRPNQLHSPTLAVWSGSITL